jgi:1-acyl-sn-glycerol-3-phosphate acyltransferase
MPHSTHLPSSRLRAAWRVLLLVLWVLIWFLPVFLMWLLRSQTIRRYLVHIFFRVVTRIIGFEIHVTGAASTARPLLLVANHASYSDVFVLASLLPISFTPKQEVRSWPVIGFFCVLADSVFVERKPSQLHEARDKMQARLDVGKALCIFPEGTTNDGLNIKPFKSGFFSLAEDEPLPIQPVTISYTKVAGTPIPRDAYDQVAWVGEATFFGHFLRLLGYPSVTVEVCFHTPKKLEDFEDRKALSGACQVVIQEHHAKVLHGTH